MYGEKIAVQLKLYGESEISSHITLLSVISGLYLHCHSKLGLVTQGVKFAAGVPHTLSQIF